MDSNRQMQELDIFLTQGFDPIPEADVTVDDVTDKLNKFFEDGSVEQLQRFPLVNLPLQKRDPVRSTTATAPATAANSITDEAIDRALDKAEDNRELSGMTRWLSNKVHQGRAVSELIAHAMQSDPARAALMEKAAENLGIAA